MLVFDTSAYLNGRRDHYPPATFPSVWELVGEAMVDGRIVPPRAVYREIVAIDDEHAEWARSLSDHFVDPTDEVQREAGIIYQAFPSAHGRDEADPFVVAEGKVRGMTVVTYEGRSFSGVPLVRWHRSMPGICRHFSVRCVTLPEALAMLGATF